MNHLHPRFWFFAILMLLFTLACEIPPICCEVLDDEDLLRIEETIKALDQNSGEWQQLLKELSDDLKEMKSEFVVEVDGVIKRATATAGVEFRCNADFIGTRIKEDLQRIVATAQNQPIPPLKPVVCQTIFAPHQTDNAINMGSVPNEVAFYGYNFDITSANALEVVLKHNGGEISLQDWVAKPSHYVVTLNTSIAGGAPLCNLSDRKVVLRWGGEELYSINVNPVACPVAPPAPPPFPEHAIFTGIDRATGNYIGGFGEDRIYGGVCTSGYKRTYFRVTQEASVNGNCGERGWVDNDEFSCRVRVHYSVKASWPNPSPNSATCKIEIFEAGLPQPQPPTPPCLCQ